MDSALSLVSGESLLCQVDGHIHQNIFSAFDHLAALPTERKYEAALEMQEYIRDANELGDDMLVRLYGIVNQRDVRATVSEATFQAHWGHATRLRRDKEQKKNRIPTIRDRLVTEWGMEVQGLYEWFEWTYNFASKLQTFLNQGRRWTEVKRALNRVLIQRLDPRTHRQRMSNRLHPTFLDLQNTVLQLEQSPPDLTTTEVDEAGCCFNSLGIVISKPRVETLAGSPYERPVIRICSSPIPFPSLEELRGESTLSEYRKDCTCIGADESLLRELEKDISPREERFKTLLYLGSASLHSQHVSFCQAHLYMFAEHLELVPIDNEAELHQRLTALVEDIETITRWKQIHEDWFEPYSVTESSSEKGSNSELQIHVKSRSNTPGTSPPGSILPKQDCDETPDSQISLHRGHKRSIESNDDLKLQAKRQATSVDATLSNPGNGPTFGDCECLNVNRQLLDEIEENPPQDHVFLLDLVHSLPTSDSPDHVPFCLYHLSLLTACLRLKPCEDERHTFARILALSEHRSDIQSLISRKPDWFEPALVETYQDIEERNISNESNGDNSSDENINLNEDFQIPSGSHQDTNDSGSDQENGNDNSEAAATPGEKGAHKRDNKHNDEKHGKLPYDPARKQQRGAYIKHVTDGLLSGFSFRQNRARAILDEIHGDNQVQRRRFKKGWKAAVEEASDHFIDQWLKKQDH